MVVQRHEEIKQHKGPRPCLDLTPLRARGAVFFVLSHASACGSHAPAWDFHAPAWATNMSLNWFISRLIRGDLMGGGGGGGGGL